MKLHLMDGTYELFRSHFGAPPRTSPSGQEVGATYGILASTLSLLREPGVTHLAAAFDTVIVSFRNEVYPAYKSGEGIEEVLLAQFPLAERALRALGVTVWSMTEFEADDALAAGAVRWADDVEQVVVLTPDKDLAQCYGHPNIVGYDRRRQAFMNADGVMEKFGVRPESIPDYLALVGDAADGLPGLQGWGAKSSSVVLERYGHLESIPLQAERWDVKVRSAEKLAETLRTHMGDALLYRFLAQLRIDVPLAENLEELEWKGARRQPFQELCDELGFDRLRNRPYKWVD
ncbi:MAG: 5'-3' exonuclease H3TH domain-containing protein [Acidimicrobiia bacterium]|nr:5'-3' exonuclease H3TH domain-containing protein [Acidimicrobiia bacterium]MDX2467518.1 5'-3' exonuclease H3TH domain-containing protein [Acidimicrobiia bacterium]